MSMQTRTTTRRAWLVAVTVVAVGAIDARADAGQLEINQTCAVETGCFPGDAPGFPVTIDAAAIASSFRLTSDLEIAALATTGIEVSQHDVTIDLGGFRIISSGCVGATTAACMQPFATSGFGIRSVVGLGRLHVFNGSIVGMANDGIDAGSESLVEDVLVRWNADEGVSLFDSSTVRRVRAIENGGEGIRVRGGSRVEDSMAFGNGFAGVFAFFQVTVSAIQSFANDREGVEMIGGHLADSVARGNGLGSVSDEADRSGIRTSSSSDATIRSSLSLDHPHDGFHLDRRAIVSRSVSSGNLADGFHCLDTCTLSRSVARSNAKSGVRAEGGRIEQLVVRENLSGFTLAPGVGYADSTLTGNGTPPGIFGGVNVGGNTCDAALCP